MTTGTADLAGALGAAGLLFWWVKDRHATSEARRHEREAACPHAEEWQETRRVNTCLLGRVVPGRRTLVKHCRGCGRQRTLYGPTLQPWASYLAEYRQETRDRTAEFQARRRAHLAEAAARRRRRR